MTMTNAKCGRTRASARRTQVSCIQPVARAASAANIGYDM